MQNHQVHENFVENCVREEILNSIRVISITNFLYLNELTKIDNYMHKRLLNMKK